MNILYVIKGKVTNPSAHNKPCSVGQTEWQFSDHPVDRVYSYDYLDLLEGVQDNKASTIIIIPK